MNIIHAPQSTPDLGWQVDGVMLATTHPGVGRGRLARVTVTHGCVRFSADLMTDMSIVLPTGIVVLRDRTALFNRIRIEVVATIEAAADAATARDLRADRAPALPKPRGGA